MNKPKAILFDAGDTIIEYIKNSPLEGTRKLLEKADNPDKVTAEEIQEYAMDMVRILNDGRETTGIEYNMRSFQRFLYEMHNIYFDLTPLEIENIFNKEAFRWKVMEWVSEFLNYLEQNNIRKAILSNSTFSEEAINEELRGYGIDTSRFEFVISTSEYGFRKPDKRIFQLALKKLGLDNNQVWYIGNSFKYDVIGAGNAGIQAIWFNKQENSVDRNKDNRTFLEVKSYKEIKDYLQDIIR